MDHYKDTFQTWDQLATQYQEKFMDMGLYNDTYDLFCREVKNQNAKILEIGCGPGNITKYLLFKRPDFKIEATDIAPNMIKLAKANNPSVDFKVMDCRHIDTLTSPVDAIICGFCLPYLSKEDCEKFITDSGTLLSDQGILYFSTIEGSYANSGYETSSDGKHRMFVYYHEEEYLLEALKQSGFHVIHKSKKQYPKEKHPATHLIFIAGKITTTQQ